jgi:hypothetical protein
MRCREMRKMSRWRFFTIIFLALALSACEKRPALPVESLGIEIATYQINQRMKLYTPRRVNPFTTNGWVGVVVEGLSMIT